MRLKFAGVLCSCLPLLLFFQITLPQLRAQCENSQQMSPQERRRHSEIEKNQEVISRIERAWDDRRREDLQFIYRLNIDDRTHTKNDKEQNFTTDVENTGSLYNNPMLQRYINAIGQRLVPKDSPNLYSFKLVLNPVPFTHAYTTGTILVSTGMVSILDNEAQLAFVLGSDIARIEEGEEKRLIRDLVIQHEFNAESEQQKQKEQARGGFLALLAATSIHFDNTDWASCIENEADKASIQYMLSQGYDARETPHVFEHLDTITTRDPRVGLGTSGTVQRLRERKLHLQGMLSGELRAQIDAKMKGERLTGSGGEFAVIMAALKRDNGIIAFNYDLFAISRDNLEEAVELRSNDARAQLYLGKVISVTARDDAERKEAEKHFLKAIEYDQPRGAFPDPHLEHALHLIGANGDKTEIANEVETYITLYQRENGGKVPENMPILYDYLTLAGNINWYAAPTTEISTRTGEALRVNTTGRMTAISAPEFMHQVASTLPPAPDSPDPTSPSKPKVARKGSPK